MLLEKSIDIKWNNATKKWYEEKGYKYTKKGELFTIDIDDMIKTSTVKINVVCDFCGKKHTKEYRNYISGRNVIKKDCCANKKCLAQKTKEINLKLYGVESCMQREDIKNKVSDKLRTSYDDVVKFCDEKGLILLSKKDEYKNDRSKLKIVCKNHKDKGIQETRFTNIKSNKGCCSYGGSELTGKSKRLNPKDIKNLFKLNNYIPMFDDEDYKNNQHKLAFICKKHKDKGLQYAQYGALQQGQNGCKYCASESRAEKLRLDEDFVFNEFKKKDLIVIDGEKYINKDSLIKYRCKLHPEIVQSSSYGNLKVVNQPCDICRLEDSISNLNRKFRSSIVKWKKKTEIKCNYKCLITGSDKYDIHHLIPYNQIIKDALNNLNISPSETDGYKLQKLKDEIIRLHDVYGEGVCIHPDIHQLFHTIYGKDGDSDDFNKFKKDYINGVYNK